MPACCSSNTTGRKLVPVSLSWAIPRPFPEQGDGNLLLTAEKGGREGNRPEEELLFSVLQIGDFNSC